MDNIKLSLSLTMMDRQFLYRKYRKDGMKHPDAKLKVSELSRKMRELGKKLRETKLSPGKLNERFKMEFEKLCNEY